MVPTLTFTGGVLQNNVLMSVSIIDESETLSPLDCSLVQHFVLRTSACVDVSDTRANSGSALLPYYEACQLRWVADKAKTQRCIWLRVLVIISIWLRVLLYICLLATVTLSFFHQRPCVHSDAHILFYLLDWVIVELCFSICSAQNYYIPHQYYHLHQNQTCHICRRKGE